MLTQRVPAPEPSPLLMVEDNPADAKLLMRLLQSAGFLQPIHWVKNGEEAIQYLCGQGAYQGAVQPQLIFLDLNLPRRDGREVLSFIRDVPKLAEVPVIVLTSSNRTEDRARVSEFPGVTFITKPKDLPEYEELAERLLNVELMLLMGTPPNPRFHLN